MITLVIGGTRSGKSEVAERIAASLDPDVTVLVPGHASDREMAARIAAHRARRPDRWVTVECGPDLVDALAAARGVVLIDSLGSWVAASEGLAPDREALATALTDRGEPAVVVTEEVGLSVHPTTEAGRAFADALGELNTRIASVADDVLFVVAGRSVRLGE